MIDMHSHILPGVDDGARKDAQALQMLEMAIQDGVTVQVLTPHIQPGVYNNTLPILEEQFSLFQLLIRNQGLNIELRLAAEVRIGPEIMPMVQSNTIPWLGRWEDYRVMLLELPHTQIPVGSINLIHWLLEHKVLPMIAHPERNRELQQDTNKLEPFLDAGCLTQVTARSITDGFGPEPKRVATQLLQAGNVTVLASDCHNLSGRPPDLSSGYQAAAEIIGEEQARLLVNDNPLTLLAE